MRGVVKKFIRNVKIARDGLLIVKQAQPFLPENELIVVPLYLLHGLITSLHITLNHPTTYQLTNIFNRSYYSLNVNDCISSVTKCCSQCQALQSFPSELQEQTSSIPPTSPLYTYAADVMRRCKQLILVIRDTFSSFTVASILVDEKHGSLRSSLIILISFLRPNPQSKVTIRVDNAPGFVGLKNDSTLAAHNILLDFGRIHNKNKNPVIEKGIRELGSEFLRLYPESGPLSSSQVAHAVNQLNSRIRNRGISAWEILYQRDQYTGEQLNVDDLILSEQQAQLRVSNQESSAKHKSKGNPAAKCAVISKGSLVYIKGEGDKNTPRCRYLVVEVGDNFCVVQKFVKSQLRSKRYTLKLNEVYPVFPDLISFSGKIRDLNNRDDDEEVDVSEVDTNDQHDVRNEIYYKGDDINKSNDVSIDISKENNDEGYEVSNNVDDDNDTKDKNVVENRSDVSYVTNENNDKGYEISNNENNDNDIEIKDKNVVEKRSGFGRKLNKPKWMDSGNFLI